MGMYTEIFAKITFKPGLEDSIVKVLRYMAGESEEPEQLPDHPFFECSRWAITLRGGSYYHQPRGTCNLWFDQIGSNWFLLCRADLKNYDGEIGKFFDWVAPYAEERGYEKTFIGYSLYEEDDEPTLVYIGGRNENA